MYEHGLRVATNFQPLAPGIDQRLAADDHVFLLNTHHTISDGWSLSVLWQELVKLYEASVQGVPAQLPQLLPQSPSSYHPQSPVGVKYRCAPRAWQ